jgi:hypothetical protein
MAGSRMLAVATLLLAMGLSAHAQDKPTYTITTKSGMVVDMNEDMNIQ